MVAGDSTGDPFGGGGVTPGGGGGSTQQTVTRFLHDGDALVAEYDGAGTMLKRYVHGPNPDADDPLIEYTGTGTAAADRRNLYADARGSVVLYTDSNGAALHRNTYDEYGVPSTSNGGRFQYTGQIWLDELGMNYYKARIYSPILGRFLQTDPIGYEGGYNLYGYAKNDPINLADPTGNNPVVGFVGGFVGDVAIQVLIEGKDISDVDVGDALVSGAVGATGIGLFNIAKKGFQAKRKFERLEKTQKAAKKAAKGRKSKAGKSKALTPVRKAASEVKASVKDVEGAIVGAGAAASVEAVGKELVPEVDTENMITVVGESRGFFQRLVDGAKDLLGIDSE